MNHTPVPTTTTYKLKSLFPTRLGVKLYLFNTNKIPKNNLYIGANINANYTQADFSELSLGLCQDDKVNEFRRIVKCKLNHK